MRQTSQPERAVPTRRVSFAQGLQEMSKHFAEDGDLISSHGIATLSALFPDGEDFFVKTVRHYRDQITDPDLKRQVNGFIGQEAMHGREHRMLNERFAELGYSTERIARWTKKGLATRWKVASPQANLAETVALEHFTATFAEMVLTDPKLAALLGDPVVTDLLMWHALEESEHKAVAFDVYKAIGGSERTRVWTMKFVRVMFVVGVVSEVTISVLRDPASREKGRLRASLKKFFNGPIIKSDAWARLKDFDRPDFHPDDRDTDELVAYWRAQLFGDEGTMTDRLVGSGAAA